MCLKGSKFIFRYKCVNYVLPKNWSGIYIEGLNNSLSRLETNKLNKWKIKSKFGTRNISVQIITLDFNSSWASWINNLSIKNIRTEPRFNCPWEEKSSNSIWIEIGSN